MLNFFLVPSFGNQAPETAAALNVKIISFIDRANSCHLVHCHYLVNSFV